MPRRQFCVAALLVAALHAAAAHAEVPVPPLRARVTDLTGTLTAAEKQALEARLADLETRKGSQVAVLLVRTTQPETVEQYALRVAESWKLGRADADDGALLLVAVDDRRVRIETGYGLEGVLPDALCKRIIEEVIVPHFRAGDLAGGIAAGIDRMLRAIEGEPLPPPRPRAPGGRLDDFIAMLPFLVVATLVVGAALRAILGRVRGAVATGGLAGLFTWMALQVLPFSLLAALAAFAFTLLFAPTRNGRWSSHRRRGGWDGGWGGGGRRGGDWGGGGGFGGGGGGFGGGGASGSW